MHLRYVAEAMGANGLSSMPVVDPATGKVAGLVTEADLLLARQRAYLRENERSRVLRMRWPFSKGKPV
jgi:CIC family chloride channel protein